MGENAIYASQKKYPKGRHPGEAPSHIRQSPTLEQVPQQRYMPNWAYNTYVAQPGAVEKGLTMIKEVAALFY